MNRRFWSLVPPSRLPGGGWRVVDALSVCASGSAGDSAAQWTGKASGTESAALTVQSVRSAQLTAPIISNQQRVRCDPTSPS
jgi:hypothetical protein